MTEKCGKVICFNFLLTPDSVWWQLPLQQLEAPLQAVGPGPHHAWLRQDHGATEARARAVLAQQAPSGLGPETPCLFPGRACSSVAVSVARHFDSAGLDGKKVPSSLGLQPIPLMSCVRPVPLKQTVASPLWG